MPLTADPRILRDLQDRWEAALPGLTGPLPPAWAPALRALSDRFNRLDQAPKGDYFSAANLDAYFAHHGWAQAESLAAIAAETPEVFSRARTVWDLGGGPGVLTLAASALVPEARFTLTDLRPEALAWAETRLKPLGLSLTTHRQRLPELPEGTPDLVLLGHVVNELDPQDQARLLARLKERLAPGGAIVILEPALMTQTRRLMALREAFLDAPWSVAAPCPCAGPCPMLALDRQWCVAELPWIPPTWFQELDRAAGLDRRHLAFAYLVARRDAPARPPVARIIGVPRPQKGKVERWVCTPIGGERWEALARHGEPAWALPRTAEVPVPGADAGTKPLSDGWVLRRWTPNLESNS